MTNGELFALPERQPQPGRTAGGHFAKGNTAKPMGVAERPSMRRQLEALIDREYPGYNPVFAMVKIVHDYAPGGDKAEDLAGPVLGPLELFRCHREIAEFVLPKLKAVEISGEVEGPLAIVMVGQDAEL